MKIDLNIFLPDRISDEGAYDLVNFFIDLTAALESIYFAQMRRHIKASTPPDQNELNNENSF